MKSFNALKYSKMTPSKLELIPLVGKEGFSIYDLSKEVKEVFSGDVDIVTYYEEVGGNPTYYINDKCILTMKTNFYQPGFYTIEVNGHIIGKYTNDSLTHKIEVNDEYSYECSVTKYRNEIDFGDSFLCKFEFKNVDLSYTDIIDLHFLREINTFSMIKFYREIS